MYSSECFYKSCLMLFCNDTQFLERFIATHLIESETMFLLNRTVYAVKEHGNYVTRLIAFSCQISWLCNYTVNFDDFLFFVKFVTLVIILQVKLKTCILTIIKLNKKPEELIQASNSLNVMHFCQLRKPFRTNK